MSDFKITTTQESEPHLVQRWLNRPLWELALLDWEKISYAAIFLLAVVSRFWNLGDRVVSHDESLHTQYSYQYYNGDGYVHTPLMHGPTLFHLTALSFWLFGHNDYTARIPVAILGVILIFIPLFLRSWIGRRGAVFASLILLISPYVTYYSRYIRHDVIVIVCWLIVFIASWTYLRDRKEQSIWWWAAGLALLYATMEISFIYTAVFGSFIVIRLFVRILADGWLGKEIRQMLMPLLVALLGAVLVGSGFIGLRATVPDEGDGNAEVTQPLAVDPTATLETGDGVASAAEGFFRWTEVLGLVIFSGGLFLIARQLRHRLQRYAEFDLIILFSTLLLPLMTAFLVNTAGRNPTIHDLRTCVLAGQESMSSLQIFFSRLISFDCWGIFLADGLGFTMLFLIPLLAVSVAVGTWWDSRRWLIAAAVFHTIFLLFYTSLFTNPGGWLSGTIDSLGYWLEQHDVQRGSQPYFYYAFVAPLYEFLPFVLSFLAIRLWSMKNRLLPAVRYWFWIGIATWLTYGLASWWYNRANSLFGEAQTTLPGLVGAAVILLGALAYWLFAGSEQARKQAGLTRWSTALVNEEIVGFFPSLVWWLVVTMLVLSYAGEKMPWLSIHFVIPMAFIAGWYAQERLRGFSWADLANRQFLSLVGLTTIFFVALFLAIGPVLIGKVQFGSLQAAGQFSVGRFLGSLVVAVGLAYAVLRLSDRTERPLLPLAWTASFLLLLALLTVRFTYMATFPNGDYATEYLVYAHGAPATKSEVMTQLETLSMRLYGDRSLKVHYDNETSWPYTWYLRTFPSRAYFGQNPTPAIREADAVLVGDVNYSKVAPFLGDDFDYEEFTYLWWPMEDYRRISWATILGDFSGTGGWRGIFDAAVREAVWNIIFYRDYTKWGEVTGRSYNVGSWPLRRTMRLYVSREAKAMLWDRGVGATLFTPRVDPYAEGELPFQPEKIIGQGQLVRPRNIAIAPDGRLFVADSGNNRIAIFDPDGNFLTAFGEFGAGPGQFNEPWGLAVDRDYIYVADTWNHRVQKLTHDGAWVAHIGQSGTVDDPASGGGLFFGPRAIVLLSQNRMLITDTGNHRLQLFDRNGNFLDVIGGIGALPGEFYEPVGLGVGPDGGWFVADTWNERIQELTDVPPYFSVTNWDVDAWNTSQSIENKPYLAVDGEGHVYVTDPEGYRVLIFDRGGTYLGRFGDYSVDTTGFGLPNGIAVDADNAVYVVDSANGAVLKFPRPVP